MSRHRPKKLTLQEAREQLRALGFVITSSPEFGEFCVHRKGAKKGEGYYTNDLADALATGKQMATLGERDAPFCSNCGPGAGHRTDRCPG